MKGISLHDFLSQGDEICSFFQLLQKDSVPHAVLIVGPEGVGKRTLALLVSQHLLCTSEHPPCGLCQACQLAEKYEHPDQILIRKGKPLAQEVKEGRATIPIEDIREVIRISGTAPAGGGKRIVLIHEADAMTPQAQNALLKTLEEPPSDTYFILVTNHSESLLNTVISRCVKLHLHAWPEDYILTRLVESGVPAEKAKAAAELADGSIGKAVSLSNDNDYWEFRNEIIRAFFHNTRRSEILSVSNGWKNRKNEAEQLLSVLESVVGQMIRFRFGRSSTEMEKILPPHWIRFSREASPDKLCALYEMLVDARKKLQFSVNFQAVIEQLLLAIMGEGNKWLQ